MLLRRFTDFILQSRLQALAAAFLLAFIPLISGISTLIAALVTLRKGMFEGALIAIAATLPCWIQFFTKAPPIATDLGTMALVSAMLVSVTNFLIWLFASVLRHGSWSFILELSIIIGMVGVGLIHIAYPDIQTIWATQLNAYLSKTLSAMSGVMQDNSAASLNEVKAQMIANAKGYVTGFFAVLVLVNTLLQLALARWWQAIIFNPNGLRAELHQIRLNYIVGILFVVVCLLSYVGSAAALDMTPVFFALFAIGGLSLVHNLAGRTKMPWLWLVLIYAVLIPAYQWGIVILAMIAFLDIGMDFRKRFSVIKR